MTVPIAMHEIGFAKGVAGRVVVMDGGVGVEGGPPDDALVDQDRERTGAFLETVLEGE